MAQRVYMIPVRRQVLDSYLALVAETDQGTFDRRFKQVKSNSERHLRTLEIGKRFAKLASDEIPVDRQDTLFNLYTACRPYFITGDLPQDAANRVRELYKHENLDCLFRAYREEGRQLELVPSELWKSIDQGTDIDYHGEEWDALFDDLNTIRGMALAHKNGATFPVEVYKEVEVAGMKMLSQDDTETTLVGGDELASHYGNMIGPNFGRIAGLSEPTWWLGRNFWLGLMLVVDLGKFALVTKRKQKRLQDQLVKHVRNPVGLFDPVAIPGYQASFSNLCEAYGTGLFIPSESIAGLLAELEDQKSAAVDLVIQATGYPPADAIIMLNVLLESLYWAREEGCGLLEGDDLVGAYGYR